MYISKGLLANRVNFKYAGRQILENKIRRLNKMNAQEVEELFVYLRDVFVLKYLPTKSPKRSLVSKEFKPVVQLKKR